MRIEGLVPADKETNREFVIDDADARPEFVTSLQVMPPDEFFGNRDGTGIAQPALDIEVRAREIRRVEGPERSVRENIDPQNLEIFAGKIRQDNEAADDGRGGGDAGRRAHHRQRSFREMSARGGDLEFCLPGHQIDRRSKRAVRAVIRNLRGQKNRHAQRHTQDI